MKKKIKWGIIIIILAGITFALYQFNKPKSTASSNSDANSAITFQISKETLIHNIEVKGKSTYENETIVYAPFTGKVQKWIVTDGQQVKKGDTLFQLSQKELQQQIDQGEANLKKQQLEEKLSNLKQQAAQQVSEMSSTEDDAKKKFIERESDKLQKDTQAELNQITSQLQEQDIQDKQSKLSQASFPASTAGIFLYDDASKLPQLVQENDRIGKIVDINKLQLITYAGEEDIFKIKVGMQVEVTINALKSTSTPMKGKVIKVSKFAKSTTDANSSQPAQFEVTISLEPNKELIAGLSLTGEVEIERKEDVIVVPTVAVMKDGNKSYVNLQQADGQVVRKDIQTGMETPEKIEVLEGLKDGDKVVLQ